MRIKYLAVPVIVVLLFTVSCSANKDVQQEKVKPVKVLEVMQEGTQAVLNYTGTVVPQELRKVAFKSSGKILKINVQKGEYIKSGQVLVQMDTQDLEFALRAAEAQLASSRAQYSKAMNGALSSDITNADLNVQKAQNAYDFVNNTYNKVKTLFDAGAVSKNDLDKAKLELDLRTAELNQAKEISSQVKNGVRDEDKAALLNQVKAAQVGVEQKQSMLSDAAMKSDVDGYVVDILNKEGEMVSAGYPVIVIRKEGIVVNVGVSQNDITKIKQNIKANINVGDIKASGKVTNISQVPDSQSRTYNVEVTVDNNNFALGSIAKVELVTGDEMGIWIPLTSVVSANEDYVYIVKGDTAEKRKISIENVKGSKVKVTGINAGDKLIIEGMLKVKDRDKVSIQQ